MPLSAAKPALPPPAADEARLILEVRINGTSSPSWWEFRLLSDGSLATSADNLRDLGFALAALPAGGAPVRLNDLPGVTYAYDAARQRVEIEAANAALQPVVLDAGMALRPLDPARITRSPGAVLNYALHADAFGGRVAATAQYELRIITRRGLATSTGYVDWLSNAPGGPEHIRLDTNWRTVEGRRAIALTIGDMVGGGGQLDSAYRLAGIQIQRDFDVRPDLVTTALPRLNASAAVPSTVDLYINGLQYFRGDIRRGPFQFRSLPSLGGGATATIVLTDATGRETRIEKPIFFVPGLLPQGMLDFSAEAGFPRLNFGADSFDYFRRPVVSGRARYGLSHDLTLEAHAQSMPHLVNGGIGAIWRVGGRGAITAGFALSRYRGQTGLRYLIQGQARVLGIDLYGSLERGDSDFHDIVTATATEAERGNVHPLPDPDDVPGAGEDPVLVAFARRTVRAGASFVLLRTGFNLAYTRVRFPERDLQVASLSVHRSLGRHVSLWGNAYRRFGDDRDHGVLVGVSVQIGPRSWASSNLSHARDSTRLASRFTRNEGSGRWSWSLSNSEILSGEGEAFRAAEVRHRGQGATFGAGIEYSDGNVRAAGFAEGALVLMGGGLFLAPTIDTSFAVVRGAGPDTPLFVDTRETARSDSHGRALLPTLRSLAPNLISIDPSGLSMDLQAERTQIEVVPDYRAGVIVDFGVAPEAAAELILADETGEPIPVGSLAFLNGRGEPVVVGHDGRLFLRGLDAQNRARIERPDAPDCHVDFAFRPVAGQQIAIGPLTCR